MSVESGNVGPPRADGAGLLQRVKRILVEPKAEWERIDVEPTTIGELYTRWVIILAAVPAVAGLIGALVFGYSFLGVTYRPGVMEAVASALTQYVMALVGVFVLALVIDFLAPKFGGTSNRVQAMKVAAYSATAAWVAGIFNIIPSLGVLGILGLYSFYLLYLGLPRVMKAPEDKAVGYTVVTALAAIVVAILLMAVLAPIAAAFGGGNRYDLASGELSGKVTVPGAGELDLGKLEQATKQLEATAAQMQSGNGQPVAAVAPASLQALLPASLGPYSRTEISSAAANAGGLGGSEAEARYQSGESNIHLEVTDLAAAGALASLGSAFNVETSRETGSGYEKVHNVDGRMVTEKWDNQSKNGTYGVLVANRFMVQAEGTVPDPGVLKQAVEAVGIDKVQALAR